MAFYLIVFSICWLLSVSEIFLKTSRTSKRIIIGAFSVLFVFLSTFYYGPLGDCYSYEDWFNKTDISHIYNLTNNNFEYLYEVIQVLAKSIVDNYVFLRFILAVLCMLLQYNILLKGDEGTGNEYPFTLLLIIWSLNFGNIFIIRSTIAVLICLFSVRFIEHREFTKFVIATIVASLFHRIAILWFVAYFVYKVKLLKWVIYAGIAVAYCMHNYLPQILIKVSSLFGSSINTKITNYIGYGIDKQFGSNYDIRFLLLKASANAIIIVLVYIYLKEKFVDIEDKYRINGLFNIFLVGFFLQVCTFQTSAAIARMATPFIAIQFFLLLRFVSYNYKYIANKLMIYVGVCLYLLLRMIVFVNSADYKSFSLRLPWNM